MIRSVYLMLGQKCNFSCRYCIQKEKFFDELPRSSINEKVIAYLKTLKNKPLLQFWGGEPLLYFADIKYLVEQLGHSFEYSIITNGALLTDSIVEFINEHDIWLTISNDGPGTAEYRNYNILDDENIVGIIGKYKRKKSFSAVISAQNYDVKAIYQYITAKFEDSYINYDFILASKGTPEDLVDFDFKKFEDYFSQYFDECSASIMTGTANYQDLLFLSGLTKDFSPKYKLGEVSCGAYTTTLNIDLLGNVYKCHNSGEIIGSIDNLQNIKSYKHSDKHLDTCSVCECINFCKMGCILMPLEIKKEYFCRLKKILHKHLNIMEKSLLC